MTVKPPPEDEPATVGEVYLVPCVMDQPVYGTPHRDLNLAFKWWHWHYDERFMTTDIGELATKTLAIFTPWLDDVGDDEAIAEMFAMLEYRPMVCVRQFVKKKKSAMLETVRAVAESVGNSRLSECMKCPHKGFNLKIVKPDSCGVVTCPDHGLKWHLKTGEMVPQ